MVLNDQMIHQTAKMAAENIICLTRSIGWDSLDYATDLIEQSIKKCITDAVSKEKLINSSNKKKSKVL